QLRDRKPLRNAAAFIDPLVVTRLKGDLLDRLPNKILNPERISRDPVARRPRFLFRYRSAQLNIFRIMRLYLGADAVLERCDYFSASGVILRVCRKHEHYVERQTNRITFYLNVALLHYVEQTDLNFACQIG